MGVKLSILDPFRVRLNPQPSNLDRRAMKLSSLEFLTFGLFIGLGFDSTGNGEVVFHTLLLLLSGSKFKKFNFTI